MSTEAAGQRKQYNSKARLRRRAVVINGLLYAPGVPAIRKYRPDHDTVNVVREIPHPEPGARSQRQSYQRPGSLLEARTRHPVKVTDVSSGHIKFASAPAKRRTHLDPIKIAPRTSRAFTTIANHESLNTPAVTMGPPSSIPMLRSKKLPQTRRQSQQQGLRLQWERSLSRLRNLFEG